MAEPNMLDATLYSKLDKVTLVSDLLFLVDINGCGFEFGDFEFGVTCGLC